MAPLHSQDNQEELQLQFPRRKPSVAAKPTKLLSILTTTVAVVIFLLGVDSCHAFSSTSPHVQKFYSIGFQQQQHQPKTSVAFPLFAKATKARRSGAGAGGGKSNSKKGNTKKKDTTKKGSPKNSKKGDGNKRASPSTSPAAASSPSSAPKASGPRAPPWQVLSQKDAKKNIQREIKRRDAIQKGEASTSDSFSSISEYGDGDDDDDFDDAPMKVSNTFLSLADKSFFSWKRFSPSAAGMRYVASVLDRQPLPRLGVPEIAFLGRSNVGKSSLLNRLSSYSKKDGGFTDEARVGKTPGATASVNLYGFYDKKERPVMGFVDLPGFGYAKLSKEVKASVQTAAERYLDKRTELVLGILLVDIRRVPSEDDRIVLAALFDQGLPILVVATKVDKVNKNDLDGQLKQIRDGLGLPEGQPFSVSSATGEGTKALWHLIMEASESGVEEFQKKMQRGSTESDEEDSAEDEDDDEEAMYSQGYDWIQESGDVVYEDIDGDDFYNGGDNGEYDDNDVPVDDSMVNPVREWESIKVLRKKAKKLEKKNMV